MIGAGKKQQAVFAGEAERVIVVRVMTGVAVEHLHAVQQGGVLPRQPGAKRVCLHQQQAFAVSQGAQLRDGIPVQLRRTVKQFGRSAEQEIVVVACGGAKLKPAVNVQAGLCPCFTRGAVAGQKAVDLLCPASCKAVEIAMVEVVCNNGAAVTGAFELCDELHGGQAAAAAHFRGVAVCFQFEHCRKLLFAEWACARQPVYYFFSACASLAARCKRK